MSLAAKPLILAVTELAHDGRGLGFLPAPSYSRKKGKAVFVRGALPGQTIACLPLRDKGSFMEANLVEIVEDISPRAEPLCPHQQECGGCPLQPLPYQTQLAWKEKLARQAMRRIGGLSPQELDEAWEPVAPSPQTSPYRNKATFAFGLDSSGNAAPGFRKGASHEICPISRCALLEPEAAHILETIKMLIGNNANLCKSLTLRKAFLPQSLQPAWWIILSTGSDSRRRASIASLGRKILARLPIAACFIHEEKDGASARITALGEGERPEIMALPLGGRIFELDAMSFFQVNGGASALLADIVSNMAELEELGGARGNALLDLYCGVGAPGQLLAHKFSQALGIEIDARATERAKANAAANGLDNCRYIAGNTGHVLKTSGARICRDCHTILADPPRAGIDPGTMAIIQRIAPQKIIYISCNPATLARDAAILSTTHRLRKLAPVDMFPHTAHLECCSLWEKR